MTSERYCLRLGIRFRHELLTTKQCYLKSRMSTDEEMKQADLVRFITLGVSQWRVDVCRPENSF